MNNVALIGSNAPDFSASAIDEKNNIVEVSLSNKIKNKFGILFFYPLNFTFVCPTEILMLNDKIEELGARNAEVLCISVDSVYSHLAWKNTAKTEGGIGQVKLTLVSDIKKEISDLYGTLDASQGFSLRGTVIIDPDFKIIFHSVNSGFVGRNVDEYIRIIDAATHNRKHGEVCPAGWTKNAKGMTPTPDGVKSYMNSK